MAEQVRKTTRGRQKIEMKKIENDEDRLISFSKRKAGIMKKAAEISIMCGAKVACIIFSATGKAYTFGHPSVKFVTDKFLNNASSDGGSEQQELQQDGDIQSPVESEREARITELAEKYNAMAKEIDSEKKRVELLRIQEGSRPKNGWWEQDVNKMELLEVMKFYELVDNFKSQLKNHMNKLDRKRKRISKTIHLGYSAPAPASGYGGGSGGGIGANQMNNNSSFMANIGSGPSTDLQLHPPIPSVLPSPSGPPLQQQYLFNNQVMSLRYPSSPQVVQHPTLDLFNTHAGAGSSGSHRADPPHDRPGGGADEDDHKQHH